MNPTLNSDDVSEMLFCSKKTVESLARSGDIPAFKIGRGFVFSTELVLDWIKEESLKCGKPVVKSKYAPLPR